MSMAEFCFVLAADDTLGRYIEAEKACDISLGQHKSVKGHWRRAQARKARGRIEAALQGENTSIDNACLCLRSRLRST